MKFTRSQLKKLIKEEMTIEEGFMDTLSGLFSKDEARVAPSRLMKKALENNNFDSLETLKGTINKKANPYSKDSDWRKSDGHAIGKLIDELNSVSGKVTSNTGNKLALSLAIVNLLNNNLEPANAFLNKHQTEE